MLKEEYALQLLCEVLELSPARDKEEIRKLQAMAKYKYDEYQRFYPGMRFVESLACWLNQFQKNRNDAYRFVREKLLFISQREMMHLVSIAYSDYIRPLLIKKVGESLNVPEYLVSRIVSSLKFREEQARTLFLGLSDGAQMGWFRRANPVLHNEQIRMTFEIPKERAEKMQSALKAELDRMESPSASDTNNPLFRNLILIDDFIGSGNTLIRAQSGNLAGKLPRISESLLSNGTLASIFDTEKVFICLVPYIASKWGVDHVKQMMEKLDERWNARFEIKPIISMEEEVRIRQEDDEAFFSLTKEYYDDDVFDDHLQTGGTQDVRLGYAGCALPLVLFHNTPNNSIYLLWANERLRYHGLFPRIGRHRSEVND